jgi:hypothetical protein
MKRDYPHLRPNQPEGEPINALLRAFFRAEMPSSWPAFRSPAPTRLPLAQARATRRPTYAGRLALAASVGLLFVGSWLLPAKPTPRAPQGQTLPTIGPASASRGGLLPVHLQPEQPGTPTPDKVKSSLHLEQGSDGRTGIKITVEEYPPPK